MCFERHGVEGVRIELLTAEGAPIDAVWAQPRYFGAGSATPEAGLQATTTNGTGYFWNVPPNEYLVRLRAREGTTLSCSLDPNDTGFSWGLEGAEPNTYRVSAVAGFNSLAGRTFCTLE